MSIDWYTLLHSKRALESFVSKLYGGAVQVGSAANGMSGQAEDGVRERRPLCQVISTATAATTGRRLL